MGALSSFQPIRSNLTLSQVMKVVFEHGSMLSRQYDIELDYVISETEFANLACSTQLPQLLNAVLNQAAERAQAGSVIEIASHNTRRGLEFEIVVSGCLAIEPVGNTFSRQSNLINGGFQLSTYQARCPDGTVAWIVVQSDSPRFNR